MGREGREGREVASCRHSHGEHVSRLSSPLRHQISPKPEGEGVDKEDEEVDQTQAEPQTDPFLRPQMPRLLQVPRVPVHVHGRRQGNNVSHRRGRGRLPMLELCLQVMGSSQLRRLLSPCDLLVFSPKGHDSTYRGQDLLSHSPGCRVRFLLQI